MTRICVDSNHLKKLTDTVAANKELIEKYSGRIRDQVMILESYKAEVSALKTMNRNLNKALENAKQNSAKRTRDAEICAKNDRRDSMN